MGEQFESGLAILEGPPLYPSPGRFCSLASLLWKASNTQASRGIFFIEKTEASDKISYNELYSAAAQVALNLQRLGLKRGDVVLLGSDNRCQFITAFWGCILAGVIAVPTAVPKALLTSDAARVWTAWRRLGSPPLLTSITEVGRFSEDVASRLISIESLTSGDKVNLPISEPHLQSCGNDIALMLMTSGSSGEPKLVMHSHRSLLSYCISTCALNDLTGHDISLNWFPLDHVGGLVMFHLRDVWLASDQIQVSTELILSSPGKWLDLIDAYRASVTWAPNFAFALINQQEGVIRNAKWDLSCLRLIINAGEQVVPRQMFDFLRYLMPFGLNMGAMSPAWGMSETASAAVYSRIRKMPEAELPHLAAVGKPAPGVCIRIADENGETLPRGVFGELLVRGDPVTSGYFAMPEINAIAFTRDGWFRSGDRAAILDDELVISGRIKDVVIINGKNVSCTEIEDVVRRVAQVHPAFVAAVGVPDERTGTEQIGLLVGTVEGEGVSLSALCEFITQALINHFQCAKPLIAIRPVNEFPKTSAGKIKRAEIQKLLATAREEEKDSSAPSVNNISTVLENTHDHLWVTCDRLSKIFCRVLHLGVVDHHRRFAQIGLDSVYMPRVLGEIRSEFGIEIRVSDVFKCDTLFKLASHIETLGG